jgi:hypothetical protein
MQQRIDVKEVAPNAYAAMLGLQVYVNKSGLEHALLELIKVRASRNRHMAPEKPYASRRGRTRSLVGLQDEILWVGRAEELWNLVRSATSSIWLRRSISQPRHG